MDKFSFLYFFLGEEIIFFLFLHPTLIEKSSLEYKKYDGAHLIRLSEKRF